MPDSPNIVGKDYLTREEAAHYACVSLRKWDELRETYQIPAIPWGGKKVYRRTDIARAIETAATDEWLRSGNVGTLGNYDGMRAAVSARSRLARSQRRKPNSVAAIRPASSPAPEPQT